MASFNPCFPLTEKPWSQALTLIEQLQDAGFGAVFVGGCVRDQLLGITVHDVDIATSARPEQVEALFPHCLDVGKQFGVMVVIVGPGEHFEVATFRGEGAYSDNRRPDTIHFTDEVADVERRDFTINALVYDPCAQELRDHIGGLQDLEQRCIRMVGNPHHRLADDRLRVLRGLRFAARFGAEIEASTWEAMQAVNCDGLSRERIWQEWDKACADVDLSRWHHLLVASNKLIDYCRYFSVPEYMNWDVLAQTKVEQTQVVLWHAYAAQQDIDMMQTFLHKEPISKERRQQLLFLYDYASIAAIDALEQSQRLQLWHHPNIDLVWISFSCRQICEQRVIDWHKEYEVESVIDRSPLITAKELLALGEMPGPGLGQLLAQIQDLQYQNNWTKKSQVMQWYELRS